MDKYKITQVIQAPSQQEAVYVANEQARPRNFGFPYLVENQTIEPVVPFYDSSMVDMLIKKAIAGVAILYISRALKNWAKS